ncbi:MAG TPA: UDP-N-acetylmuramate dehydrogenase [Gemmatimonadales bacterium]|nr:UDP-N-acetylmuramate dehydrogenase [Gemmatimonadales bacterium]
MVRRAAGGGGTPDPRRGGGAVSALTGGLADLRARVKGDVREHEPLARYTTYRIGGPGAAVLHARSAEDVAAALEFAGATGTPWVALGLGSNVLVADAGFAGLVLRIGKGMDEVAIVDPHTWTAGAGLPTPLLARRTAAAGLGGVHRLVGVPGTVGGGVVMNAGAHGQEFASVVQSVRTVAQSGAIRDMRADSLTWRYRDSGLRDVVVVGATLRLEPADHGDLEADVRRHLAWRKAGTPFDQPCCGSVFRNPPPVNGERRTAGQLIDQAGLKGFTIGRAQVSPLHANYIVNLGEATADQVRAVMDAVRERVLKQFGLELALEVRMVG